MDAEKIKAWKMAERKQFLADVEHVMTMPDIGMEEIITVFRWYSNYVHIENMEGRGCDFMVCFETGEPVEDIYTFTEEGDHWTSKKYSPSEYEEQMVLWGRG